MIKCTLLLSFFLETYATIIFLQILESKYMSLSFCHESNLLFFSVPNSDKCVLVYLQKRKENATQKNVGHSSVCW